MAYLYRHIRHDKNEVFYVGIGTGHRAWQKIHRNRYWKHIVAISKYDVEIIIDNLTWGDAIKKEKEFIALYGRKDCNQGTLVNMTDGGEGMLGYIATEEVRKKISEKKKGVNPRPEGWKMTEEGKKKMSIASKGNKRCLGRVLSNDTKCKISKSLVGSEPNNNIPVIQYSKDGVFINEFKSADEAGRIMGSIHGGHITKVCKKRDGARTANGFQWFYKSEVVDGNGNVKINIDPIQPKYTDEQIGYILNSGLSNVKLGKLFGVSSTTIFYIKKTKNKTINGSNFVQP